MENISKIIQKRNSSAISTIECKEQWAVKIIDDYKSPANFMLLFNPGKQAEYCSKLERCFIGNAPSLVRLKKTFGIETAKSWLVAQLIDLSLFSSIKEKPELRQIESIADTIILNYGFLKVTELFVFLQRFKAGKHGIFYGAIDGIVINSAINDFIEGYRRSKINEFENKLYL